MTHRPFCDHAARLLVAGYSPVLIVPGTKRPAQAGWQRWCKAPMPPDAVEQLARSSVAYGIGLALGYRGLIAIDVDTDAPEILDAIRKVLA